MKRILGVLALIVLIGCGEDEIEAYKQKIIKQRKETNKEFLSDASPLEDEDKKNFVGLNYYPVNPEFSFWATYNLYETPDTFVMPTTTERTILMMKEGYLNFMVKEAPCTLQVFYDVEKFLQEGEKNYFIPFSDETSGFDTYGGGRYLEVDSLKENNTKMWIDFNTVYNPYCAYNHNFSCPLPPKENHLNVKIEAGEMNFH